MRPVARRIALYARVSTREQDATMQMESLREYAARRGADATEFVDEGRSGADRDRPRLDALMVAVRRREVSAVVVWKFDRLARSVSHLSDLLQEFQALDVSFVSLTESVDTSTPAGRMLYHVLAAVAEFERDLIRERVTAGMAAAKRAGRTVGRPRLTFDMDELHRLRGAGLSIRQIAATAIARDPAGNPRHASASLVAKTLRESGATQ